MAGPFCIATPQNPKCPNITKPHPFAVLPFSHGMRNCPGKRIAENELLTYIVKVVENFKIHPVTTDIEYVSQLSIVPKDIVSFRFEKRK